MHKTKTLIFAILLAGSASCGRKDAAEKGTPKLASPEPGGYSRFSVPAAASVSASSGAVKFSLSMPTTHYRVEDRSLWVKATITNVGNKPFFVYSKSLVSGPSALMSVDHWTLDVVDAAGKTAFYRADEKPYPPDECRPQFFGLERRELVAKYGFSLEVGKSTSTPAMGYPLADATSCRDMNPDPIGEFGEIKGFYFLPGKYKVRAVYDRSFHEIRGGPEKVRVETPWIEFDVEK